MERVWRGLARDLKASKVISDVHMLFWSNRKQLSKSRMGVHSRTQPRTTQGMLSIMHPEGLIRRIFGEYGKEVGLSFR
jgi:hypothetical protein